jgi:hypothetical protein
MKKGWPFAWAVSLGLVGFFSRPPTPPLRLPDSAPVLPRASTLMALFGSHRHLLADYYWLQASYHAGLARTRSEYRDVAYYANLVTDLDPDFRYAYVFGALVAPYNLGREQWVNTAESTALLEKGLRRFPEDSELLFILAYNESYFHEHYARAAQLLERAAQAGGAPFDARALATRLYATGDSFEAALAVAEGAIAQAKDEETRQFFEKRKKEIELERVLKSVEKAAQSFRTSTGRLPYTADELLVTGYLNIAPVDPFGGSIVLDDSGRASSTVATSGRLEVFLPSEHPRHK